MLINTRAVQGRRVLHFSSLEEVGADAEHMATFAVAVLGNWSFGQIYRHLSFAVDGSVYGFQFRMPLPVIWWTKALIKRKILTRGLKPGFRFFRFARAHLVWPVDTSTADGLAALQAAIAAFKLHGPRHAHPILGRMTVAEWRQFHLRHAELHLSFAVSAVQAVPTAGATAAGPG